MITTMPVSLLPVALLAVTLLFASPAPGERSVARQPPSCPPAEPPPARLPEKAAGLLREARAAASRHQRHVWRDTPAVNADGTVNVFIEIPAGSSEKREFDLVNHRLELNRRVPESLGGYPAGYGFIPQTIGIDGDPYDGLVVGSPTPAGELVRGHVLGIMHMSDEKGHDAKIVVTAEPDAGTRQALLNTGERARIASFFNRYKAEDEDEDSWACVSGWGDEAEARRYLDAARRLFGQP